MNIIVPMAGMGKRMRPHTLTVPKPLIPIAGKPIVQRLVEDICKVCEEKIDHIGFVVGRFGQEVEDELRKIASSVGAEARIFYQDEALGTAHAILCAQDILEGNTIVAFADTLFRADFKLDTNQDGIIWVHKVEDPSMFGVVKVEDGAISDFVEKPSEFISDLAIIGIYYFKEGETLRSELQYLIDNNVIKSGEYQLTDALENMKQKGIRFVPGEVEEWLDCGNKNAAVLTNQRYLEFIKEENLVSKSAKIINSVIISPVYVGDDVELINTVIGPHVSVGNKTYMMNSRVSNSIIQNGSTVKNANIANSMLGNFVTFEGKSSNLSIGDYNYVVD